MTQTTQLDIPLVDPNQSNKAVTINQALSQLATTAAGSLSIDASTHATPYTIPYTSADNGDKTALAFVDLTITGALSGAWVGIVPAKNHLFLVTNNTTGGFSVTIKVTGMTGVVIPATQTGLLYCNGTDVVSRGISGGSGAIVPGAGVVLSNGTVLTTGTVTNGITLTGSTLGLVPVAAGVVLSNGTILTAGTVSTGLTLIGSTLTLTPVTAGFVLSNGTIIVPGTIGTTLSLVGTTLNVAAIGAGLVYSNGTIQAPATVSSDFSFTSGTLSLATATKPYEPKFGFNITPVANQLIFGDFATRAVSYPGNFAGSIFRCNTAAAATWVAVIKKNGSNVGTLTVTGGATSGVFATTAGAAVTLAANDYMEVVCPTSVDGSIANGYGTFVGTR